MTAQKPAQGAGDAAMIEADIEPIRVRAWHSSRVLYEGALEERWLVCEEGCLVDIAETAPHGVITFELGDAIVAPGFVDTHIHGYAGVDVLTCSVDELFSMGNALAQAGTTSWLATFPAASKMDMEAACVKVAQAVAQGCPGCKGIYLEGPFLAPYRAGAQNKEHLIDPSLELLDRWRERSGDLIKKIAVAPELDGAIEFIRGCVERGIVVAIGHSEAGYDEALEALEAGASEFVHVFNAMSGLHHRAPGLVGAALTCDGTFCELIADESHVNRVACDILLRARSSREVALVTDCLSAAGTPDGLGRLGDTPVIAQGSVCHIMGGHMLAGTTLTLCEAVEHIVMWGLASLEETLPMASEVPARSCGLLGSCGSLRAGVPADFVVLDDSFNLLQVVQAGRPIKYTER